jgi:hypothetical protein
MLGETLSHGPIVEKLEGGGTDGVDQAEDTASPNRESRGQLPPRLRMVC